jgi:uncharacterized repeat protein (TIGR01451 family)
MDLQQKSARRTTRALAAAAFLLARGAFAQASPPPGPAPTTIPSGTIGVVTTAAVERHVVVDGHARIELVPANRVVAGDPVIYTLRVTNLGPVPVTGVVVTTPIPGRMRYVAGTAIGPGAKIGFSVDGGRTYAAPGRLRVTGADGRTRPATAADYTNLRWLLQDPLQSGSVAYLRYTAVLR